MLTVASLCVPLAARADACIVEGQKVFYEDIRVDVENGQSFAVKVGGVTMRATLGSKKKDVPVVVSGALPFEGHRERIDVTLAREWTSADGALTLSRGTLLVGAHVAGTSVVGAVVMSFPFCGGAELERIEAVALPCAALTLDSIDVARAHEPPRARALPRWQVRRGARNVRVHQAPDQSSPARVLTFERAFFDEEVRLGATFFEQLERRGDWVRVRRRGRGVELLGWVHTSVLQALPPPSTFGYSDATCGMRGFERGGRVQPIVVTIPVGTPLYYGEHKVAWTTVGESGKAVALDYGEPEWISVRRFGGVTMPQVFVRRDAVQDLQANADPAR